jgi:hypothetical protein
MNTVAFSVVRIGTQVLGKSVSWIPTTVARLSSCSIVRGLKNLYPRGMTYLTGKLTPVLYTTDALLTVYWLSLLFVYTF